MSVDYIGQRYEPTNEVTIVAGKIPPQYKMIGKATLTSPGNYTGYEIKQKLIKEAKSVGADSFIIVSSERKESGSYTVPTEDSSGFEATSAAGAGNWNPDGTEQSTDSFGQTGLNDTQTVITYETIVKAYFLRLRKKESGQELLKQQNLELDNRQTQNQQTEKK